MSVLEDILRAKRERVAAQRAAVPWSELEALPLYSSPRRSLAASLRRGGEPIRFLCEIKRASPSAGEIRPGADAAAIARAYRAGGAAGISLVTEQDFFRGRPEDLPAVREAGLPVLLKDFLVDPYQVVQGRALGADAVLLIVAARDRPLLAELRATARESGCETLVEIHGEEELEDALRLDPEMIGVNHRDLRSFRIDLARGEALLPLLPPDLVRLAESGIGSRSDVLRMEARGFDALLVGEALMRAPDPERALLSLRGVPGA